MTESLGTSQQVVLGAGLALHRRHLALVHLLENGTNDHHYGSKGIQAKKNKTKTQTSFFFFLPSTLSENQVEMGIKVFCGVCRGVTGGKDLPYSFPCMAAEGLGWAQWQLQPMGLSPSSHRQRPPCAERQLAWSPEHSGPRTWPLLFPAQHRNSDYQPDKFRCLCSQVLDETPQGRGYFSKTSYYSAGSYLHHFDSKWEANGQLKAF